MKTHIKKRFGADAKRYNENYWFSTSVSKGQREMTKKRKVNLQRMWQYWIIKISLLKLIEKKTRTATAYMKDMNVRNNKPQIGSRNFRKKVTNVQLYLYNSAISETRKALNKQIFEKQTSSARVVYAK